MIPHDSGPRRRNWRKALRGVPKGRRVTRKVVTQPSRWEPRERDDLAEFCANLRAVQNMMPGGFL